ncbi:MAG: thermostable hemolysin [Alsobacter sp.]
MHFRIVEPADELRQSAETLIRKTYDFQYGARISGFPYHVLAGSDPSGAVVCAAGLRFAAGGFFSEAYLDQPIEDVLGEAAGRIVRRESVFEVTTLVSACPAASALFIRRIVAHGEAAGFAWSFFTLTERLRRMLPRLGLPVVPLAPAHPARISDAEDWGRYYACNPVVCAVPGLSADFLPVEARHADAA